MKSWAICAGAVLGFVCSQPSLAAVCATVTFSPGAVTLPNYDPIAGGAVQSSFTATINRVQPGTRSARLIFNDSSNVLPVTLGAIGNKPGPVYEILDPGGANVVFRNNPSFTGKTNQLIDMPAGAGGDSVTVNYTVNIPANSAGADLRNGDYAEALSYAIKCFDGHSVGLGTDSSVTGPALSLTIPNLVSLTTASPQTLDFENFTTLTQQLNVGLKSTGPINVDLRTENGRKMVRIGASSPAPLNSTIAYAIQLNGKRVSSDPYILNNAPRAGVAGSQWPLLLSLPAQPSGKVAGDYSDTITLTLTPGS